MEVKRGRDGLCSLAMRLILHHTKFYDWVPVPSGTKITQADIASGRVKPDAREDRWRMRVAIEQPTHTMIGLPESQIIAKIIYEKCRPDGMRAALTRRQAVTAYVAAHTLPNHAHHSWLTGVEVHDDGPDEKLFRAIVAPHLVAESARVSGCKAHSYANTAKKCAACGHNEGVSVATEPNISPLDLQEHLAAYMEPAKAEDFVEHLVKTLKIKAAKVAS
jgi:hypothetical protein